MPDFPPSCYPPGTLSGPCPWDYHKGDDWQDCDGCGKVTRVEDLEERRIRPAVFIAAGYDKTEIVDLCPDCIEGEEN